ncbi:MAG: methionyl-tRNA formyltransferase [Caulobacterales bacterium]|nr:methionyl-tRNA formyltransferase [Caulobacterales bacterium]
MSLRLAFLGTPDFAAPALSEIVAAGHEVACVYAQPPRPAGRGKEPRPAPVQALAEALRLPVRTPASFKDRETLEAFAALELDAAIVVAYGQILPAAALRAPRLGCFNLHASLLPRWRGAAPIQRAIMAGDEITGVQVMRMEEGLDTGPILLSETVRIYPFETAGSLHDRLRQAGAQLLPRFLSALERGSVEETPQAEEGVTYAAKIDKAEARIDWSRPAVEIDRQIRGLSPFPGAWFEIDVERCSGRVKALASVCEPGAPTEGALAGQCLDDHLLIATGAGAVRLTMLQREGRKAQNAEEFLRGAPVPKGVRFT